MNQLVRDITKASGSRPGSKVPFGLRFAQPMPHIDLEPAGKTDLRFMATQTYRTFHPKPDDPVDDTEI